MESYLAMKILLDVILDRSIRYFLGILRDTGFFTFLCVLRTPRCDLNVRQRCLYIVVRGY